MLIYLVRHGIAIDREDPNCPPEPERHLTPKGMQRTREAARGLRKLGIAPRVALSSPYLRALQTAEIVCEELKLSPGKLKRTAALLPEAAPAELLRELKKLTAEEVICFGHAPNLDVVIAHAIGAARPVTELKKAGAACVELESIAAGRGVLVWVATAKMLKKVG
jgi:phosphohistidine phosphatase